MNISQAINTILNMPLRQACMPLLGTDYARFFDVPASLSHHHCGDGGLATHTCEVIDYGLHLGAKFGPVFKADIFLAAALWHDVCKIHEYERCPEAKWKNSRTGYQHTIGHICGSAAEFLCSARACGVDQTTTDAVVHAILAHHGPVKEWGSPVAPQSLEALILHQADMLSAHYGLTK